MNVRLIIPDRPELIDGNRVTAERWARILRELGHRARVQRGWDGGACDMLVALNAVKSYESARAFRAAYPDRPLIVALTGTDVYRDLPRHKRAFDGLRHATRLIALQERALRSLPRGLRARTRVIYQSADAPATPPARVRNGFQVCVVGHLRDVKDPFRILMAVRQLPEESELSVVHIGKALTRHMRARARTEDKRNPRYRWLGEVSPARTRRIIAQSHLVVITSRVEGSSNVLSEALAARTPVIATRIPGLVGTLGSDFPGYFPVGDTRALARLLRRAEADREFYRRLDAACRRAAAKIQPARELAAWRKLLREIR